MGAMYLALPLNTELREWLAEFYETLPPADGREATALELREAIGALSGMVGEYSTCDGTWEALITEPGGRDAGPWALAVLGGFVSEDVAGRLSFHKGWQQVIVRVLCKLAQATGPWVLVADVDCTPLVVAAGDDPDALLVAWERWPRPTTEASMLERVANKAFKLTRSQGWRHCVPPPRRPSQLNAMFYGRHQHPRGA
jgi:hypothetical protein